MEKIEGHPLQLKNIACFYKTRKKHCSNQTKLSNPLSYGLNAEYIAQH